MQVWLYTLGSVVLVSLVALVGLAVLAWQKRDVASLTPHLVSLAVGALLGGALLHLLPRALRQASSGEFQIWLLCIAGFIGSFVLEKFLRTHRRLHSVLGADASTSRRKPALAGMVLIGDGVHNLLDGIVIAASYSVDIWTGAVTTLAVFLHELPQEIGDFGALLHSGLSAKRALLYNFLSGLSAILGAVLILSFGLPAHILEAVILPLAAGNFLYIAAADLVPELHHEYGNTSAWMQIGLVVLGVLLMVGVRVARQQFG